MRAPDEDTQVQRARLKIARAELEDALYELKEAALKGARAAGTKTGQPDLPAVYAALNRVRRAEETVDTCAYDLHTAAGGDG